MSFLPLTWHPRRKPAAPGVVAPPAFQSLTVMLTEFCNLDCWMCDFAVSKGLDTVLPWAIEGYVDLLRHPYFQQLHTLCFTGGEPFSYAQVKPLYGLLQDSFPDLAINFSSNATLLKPMVACFETTRNWNKTRLYTSIDGIASHDVQRGKPGAFDKSMRNLAELRRRFPALTIDIKFTITPVNHAELRDAYSHCTDLGLNFTCKMLENNPYYTNQLSYEQHQSDFSFSEAQLASVRQQLEWMLSHRAAAVTDARHAEIREVYDALAPDWRRSGRCNAPRGAAFLDSKLNLFTCKEYPPVLNLHTATLDELPQSPVFSQIIAAEQDNTELCTRCTSQLKRRKAGAPWARWLA